MTLLAFAFATERCAVAPLLLGAAVDRYVLLMGR